MQELYVQAVRTWAGSSRCCDPVTLSSHFRKITDGVPWVEVSLDDLCALLRECMIEDDGRWPDAGFHVTGIPRGVEIGDVSSEPPYASWPKEVVGAYITIRYGYGFHRVGKIDEDRFLLSVHLGGSVARAIETRRESYASAVVRGSETTCQPQQVLADTSVYSSHKKRFEERLGRPALCGYCHFYLDGLMSRMFPPGRGTCNLADLRAGYAAPVAGPGKSVEVVGAQDVACDEFKLSQSKAFDAGVEIDGEDLLFIVRG